MSTWETDVNNVIALPGLQFRGQNTLGPEDCKGSYQAWGTSRQHPLIPCCQVCRTGPRLLGAAIPDRKEPGVRFEGPGIWRGWVPRHPALL